MTKMGSAPANKAIWTIAVGGRVFPSRSTIGIKISVRIPAINATKSITPLSTVNSSMGSTKVVYQRQVSPMTSAASVDISDNIHATFAAMTVFFSAAS